MMSAIEFVRSGGIGRWSYFWLGTVLLILKQFVDRSIAAVWTERWDVWSYWLPLGRLATLDSLSRHDRDFLLTLTAVAIPFVLVGVVLTLARLRALCLPLWLVVLFFFPVLNLLFFLILAGANGESGAQGRSWARVLPASPMGNAILAALLTSVLTALVTVLNTRVFGVYGAGLFIALPFCLGLLAALLYGAREPRSLKDCVMVAALAACIPGFVLLVTAIEGVGCLAMAIPLAIPLAMFGGLVGYAIQAAPNREVSASLLLVPILFSPIVGGSEALFRPSTLVYRVTSEIDVAAPPQAVWNQVVSFSEIPEPTEWLFRAGIAYPMRARISGSGPGAVRRCEFSTGPFIEPIEVWDEPRLLRFGVTHNPAPMNEWSPYGSLDTPHLRGYLASRQGQFLLTALPNGHTRLAGTTWYTHGLQPAGYWRVWSDYIIHRIHMRVLNHIKKLAENS